MPNIEPISVGHPVFLTKNGRGKFAIIDMEEYEKNQATIKLFSKLMEAEKAVKNGGEWLTNECVRESLKV